MNALEAIEEMINNFKTTVELVGEALGFDLNESPMRRTLRQLSAEGLIILEGACGDTGDDMFCACGCGGDDSRCDHWASRYQDGKEVDQSHTCCKVFQEDWMKALHTMGEQQEEKTSS
jgi:hypothetical protein